MILYHTESKDGIVRIHDDCCVDLAQIHMSRLEQIISRSYQRRMEDNEFTGNASSAAQRRAP